jgi:hypothetical protein
MVARYGTAVIGLITAVVGTSATSACSDVSQDEGVAEAHDAVTIAGGAFKVANACGGLVLDVAGASTADGAPIIAWSDTGARNQQLTLTAGPNGTYVASPVSSGKVLDVAGGGTADGTPLLQWTANGGSNQRFFLRAAADGTYQIAPAHASTKLLTVGGSRSAGAPVQLAAPNGSCAQRWRLVALGGTTPTPTPTGTGTPAPTTPPAPSAPPAPPPSTTHDYVEEFDKPIALGQWPSNGSAPTAYPKMLTYADGTSGKYYPSQVLSVHDGVLDYYNHDAMAAAVLPFGYEGFTYGTYTVRMRLAASYPGYHNAFLLWPNTGTWPSAGEFDYPENETAASNPYAAVVQSNATFLPAKTTYTPSAWTDGKFHDYTIQWAPGEVRFFQDGVFVTKVNGNVPNAAMHPVMQNEFSNTLKDPAKPSTSITGHTLVDRVTYDKSYTIAP